MFKNLLMKWTTLWSREVVDWAGDWVRELEVNFDHYSDVGELERERGRPDGMVELARRIKNLHTLKITGLTLPFSAHYSSSLRKEIDSPR